MGDSAHQPVRIDAAEARIHADLTVSESSRGIVIFAHGSGSSRHSPRNRYVSDVLVRHGFATLLVDLLTEAEDEVDRRTAAYRFDTDLLADRLVHASSWTRRNPETSRLPIGYFGASTGAAAALIAASREAGHVRAIVSRGGRPDLAPPAAIRKVRAPTLFIVGGRDTDVLRLNRQAAEHLTVPHEISVVEGATHLFEESGALARVSALAGSWFRRYMASGAGPADPRDADSKEHHHHGSGG